jgi:ribokinase
MGHILVVGSSNTDMIVRVPRLPGPGETILGGEFRTAAGGKGANQAVAAARAGADVSLITAVGDDALGEKAVDGFAREGIRTEYVVTVPGAASGVALILVDEAGENSIAVAPGANASLRPAHLERAAALFARAEVVLLQLEIPLDTVCAAARMAKDNGARVILNPAPARPLPDELLSQVDLLTPNETEAALLAGATPSGDAGLEGVVSVLLSRGAAGVLVTLGQRGAFVATAGLRSRVPAFQVTPVDTTAAGDVFNGALAAALARGTALPEAVEFASAAAAISVTREGAQPSAPGYDEVLGMLASRGWQRVVPGTSEP